MTNRRNSTKGDKGRVPGGFVAMPWAVLDCPAYMELSPNAKCLLMDVARQFVRDNNGRLLLSRAHMEKRGWRSVDMLTKGKKELMDAGFIFETVKGQRPNKASWYAVTWRLLDPHPSYDAGAALLFERGAYEKRHKSKNAQLIPSHGTEAALIAPPHGTGDALSVPPHGAISPPLATPSVPPHGHHLEKPYAIKKAKAVLSSSGASI